MKEFSCGDVVPGCTAHFEAPSEQELLQHVALHARDGHGLTELPDSLVQAVRMKIRTVEHG